MHRSDIQIILGIKGGAWWDRVGMHVLIYAILSYLGILVKIKKKNRHLIQGVPNADQY